MKPPSDRDSQPGSPDEEGLAMNAEQLEREPKVTNEAVEDKKAEQGSLADQQARPQELPEEVLHRIAGGLGRGGFPDDLGRGGFAN
jgi:hypothetical protein